jgi:hypothetical protein
VKSQLLGEKTCTKQENPFRKDTKNNKKYEKHNKDTIPDSPGLTRTVPDRLIYEKKLKKKVRTKNKGQSRTIPDDPGQSGTGVYMEK